MARISVGTVTPVPKGDYNATTTYNRLNWVKYNGALYCCKANGVVGVSPENTEFWMKQLDAPTDADGVNYDNSTSGLEADKVQGAVDEIVADLGETTTALTNALNLVKNELHTEIQELPKLSHNVPRLVPKDITPYYNDGTLWSRINGTNGFSEFEDIYVGDYFKMSRPISAYERTGQYQTTGSQYVTVASINGLWGVGDSSIVTYNHLVMVAGQGFGGTQHFGRSRMNSTNTTVGGYADSEMHTTTLGAVTSSGSTSSTATINQQLYAEFGSHLKTTRELLSNSLNAAGYNRFGTNEGCSNNWAWASCQAVLMSEIEVYGSTVWSSSGYDTGTAKKQLELFAHNTQTLNNRIASYWLKDVASSAYFCYSDGNGGGACGSAGGAYCFVRPRFVLS